MIKENCICLGVVFMLILIGVGIGCSIPSPDDTRPKEKDKINLEEEVAYYRRAKKLVFTELKEKLGGATDKIPLISICPIHDCCIMQPKNNEMIHHQF